jgi:hypothetical protein
VTLSFSSSLDFYFSPRAFKLFELDFCDLAKSRTTSTPGHRCQLVTLRAQTMKKNLLAMVIPFVQTHFVLYFVDFA